jgi:hypothetical protein
VHEHIVATVVRLNEAEAFLRVEPLYSSSAHTESFLGKIISAPRDCAVPSSIDVPGDFQRRRGKARVRKTTKVNLNSIAAI